MENGADLFYGCGGFGGINRPKPQNIIYVLVPPKIQPQIQPPTAICLPKPQHPCEVSTATKATTSEERSNRRYQKEKRSDTLWRLEHIVRKLKRFKRQRLEFNEDEVFRLQNLQSDLEELMEDKLKEKYMYPTYNNVDDEEEEEEEDEPHAKKRKKKNDDAT